MYLPMPMLLISLLDSVVAGSRISVQVNVRIGTYNCGVGNTSLCCIRSLAPWSDRSQLDRSQKKSDRTIEKIISLPN